jgi:hypothetical protein
MLLERTLLARRLHHGVLQDLAATMLGLQALAAHAEEAGRAGLEDAVAILVDQQRAIRQMIEDMLAGSKTGRETGIAEILEAVAAVLRQSGRSLTWQVQPADARLAGETELAFRLGVLKGIAEAADRAAQAALTIDVRAEGGLQVTIGGAGLETISFSVNADGALS